MASHLEDDASLLTATHVCHFWRTTLLSSSPLWSLLRFTNQERALAYLERSKLAPLRVSLVGLNGPSELVRESLNQIAARVATLWAAHGPFLDDLLAHSMPKLEVLEIINSDNPPPKEPAYLPSLTSLAISGFGPLRFHTPVLTAFHLTYDSIGWTTSVLLNFLRNCPLLEVASFGCMINSSSDEVVSLPLLRSFTHESPWEEYQLCLLDRVSLPSTCQMVLTIKVTGHGFNPWIPGLPTPRDSSYLSDIRTVKITTHSHPGEVPNVTFKIELANSTRGPISFDRTSYYPENTSDFSHQGFLEILESIEMGTVETLCFDRYPVPDDDQPWDATTFIAQVLSASRNLKTLILGECHITNSLHDLPPCLTVDTLVVSSWPLTRVVYDDVVNRLQEFVELRKKAGFPLKALTLVSPVAEPRPSELEQLRGCVGCVEVVRGYDALNWDINTYLRDRKLFSCASPQTFTRAM